MKTKIKTARLLAVILTLVFLFCAAMPFTVSAAPEDETASPGTEVSTEAPAENDPPAEGETPAEDVNVVPNGATPPYHSTGNIIENVRQNSAEDEGLQFVIFKTDSGKIFYLVIDYDKGSDNVYLLTEVGENDLLNFVEVDANGNPVTPPQGNNGSAQQNPNGTQPEAPAKNSNAGLIVMIIAVLGIGGAAFYFFKSKKGKNKPLKAADFDYDDEDEYEDEPTVNEDDEQDE